MAANSDKPQFTRYPITSGSALASRNASVWMDDAQLDVALYSRADLAAGQHLNGPAIVAQDDTTTVILPGYVCRIDEYANLRISRGESQ